jgi:hypothetical protein
MICYSPPPVLTVLVILIVLIHENHRTQQIVQVFHAIARIDYHETFAPMVKWQTNRTITAMAARQGWKIHHMDVCTAFLNGENTNDIYMMQPQGLEKPGK